MDPADPIDSDVALGESPDSGTHLDETQVADFLEQVMRTLTAEAHADPDPMVGTMAVKSTGHLPTDVAEWVDDLASKVDTYRDGALSILAFPVARTTQMDLVSFGGKGRPVSLRLAEVLRELSIACKQDALQTRTKGRTSTVGQHRASWNSVLEWASRPGTPWEQIESAFYRLAWEIAQTSRELTPMPETPIHTLTFSRVAALVDDLLATGSNGMYEQFIFTALKWAAVTSESKDLDVKTKNPHASDASAGTVSDVEVRRGQHVVRAFEVTANSWESKVGQAVSAFLNHGVPVTVVAKAAGVPARIFDEAFEPFRKEATHASILNIAVLDLTEQCRSLIAALDPQDLRRALAKLYELIRDVAENDVELERYVALLVARGFVEAPAGGSVLNQ